MTLYELTKLPAGREWTMQRIAAALGVSRETITKDLAGLVTITKPPRPKGGRRKGAARRRKRN